MSENNNLPTLTGEASGTNIGVALQNLIANLHHNSGYDDVSLTLHVDESANGNRRTCFSYKCFKHAVKR